MRQLRAVWGIGLCLGLAGCAGTGQRAMLGPGSDPGAQAVLAAHAAGRSGCGCGPAPAPGPALRPAPPASSSTQPVPLLASRPDSPAAVPPAARFFPRFDEPDGAVQDPLETPRPDWLGVRTRQASQEPVAPTERDTQPTPRLASAEEETRQETTTTLPLVMRIAVSSDPDGEGSGSRGPIAHVVEAEPPPRAIALEYVDDPAPAGRARQGNDGPALPGQRTRGGPIRYGPEPTFPAAYYAADSAPTSVPRTREVWPSTGAGAGPARPTLLARVWRRLRTAAGGGRDNTPAPATAGADPALASTGAEPRYLAQHGERVERLLFDSLDKSAER